MVGVISLVSSHDSPKNPRVLVGERHCHLLPTAALAQSLHPLRDGVIVVFTDQNDRLGTLYQQGSQVVAASLGDAAQAGLAAAGILFRCQPQPGTELGTIFELFEVTDCGHHCRRGDDSHSFTQKIVNRLSEFGSQRTL